MKRKIICAILVALSLQSCQNTPKIKEENKSAQQASTAVISHYVTNNFPHDTSLFTEGLFFHQGKLFESTGSPLDMPSTRSLIGIQNLKTGKLDIKIELDRSKYFGEGSVILKDKLYQLSYKTQVGFIYDATTFKKLREFKYANAEGWGLTTDSVSLIMSDGTNKLTFLDPNSLMPVKTLEVTENGQALDKLNELEFINGFIYANVWGTNDIVKIDPATAKVIGKLNFNTLALTEKNNNPEALEMNGIAYDAASDKMYVTGKLWANIYEIDLNK
ncbi:glutaminyl-peptide cyclotransferase [Pedobacter caeni]|uniref:Glutamine cyclotransferase n=1 Tax=Pedobacter caeni TaxID=288992 RepID=A0A1M4YV12_9SPHI|nr:glutaminyl-peptide cyclotransferase [Pedobacter caeni]SHF09600.1 Glutamine cyclotransferase [Pedobacter caeni]